jgi:hypothetical protein
MADSTINAPSVWQALDTWSERLAPWQRRILAYAARARVLSEDQIGDVYRIFLEESALRKREKRDNVPVDISGRQQSDAVKSFRLDRVSNLAGINALPDGASLVFGPALTVIYGRNGAGKSGFARLFANACFSRCRPSIIANIYDDMAPSSPTAKIHVTLDGVSQEILFTTDNGNVELRRISFFDDAVARHHVSQASPFEFKPSGFDVFPEMARVYREMGVLLDADIRERTHDTKFSDSFIGPETTVSEAVSSIGAATDLAALRTIATYGATEKARLDEIDKQLTALKSRSPKDVLAQLAQARSDVVQLNTKFETLARAFTADRAVVRTQLSKNAKQAAEAAAALGSEQFKRPFFSAIGTPEWQAFAKAAHALGAKEGAGYPAEGGRCLLCERPFDEESRKHVATLLSFVEGDAQRKSEAASAALGKEIAFLEKVDLNIFTSETRVREHIHRIDPVIETAAADVVDAFRSARDRALEALRARNAFGGLVDAAPVSTQFTELTARIETDIQRLENDDVATAVTSLELERQTLRHREVLSQLLPAIERDVTDAAWCAKAVRAKSLLNPRHITEKEKELFAEIIGESYRARLAAECEKLDCELPIELQTAGHKGKTVRSLSMKGGYQPDAILSQGEQKAVALADFLTEVGLNTANAGVIFDDPVSSQDHERKDRIAQRLVEEAAKRQVIVFTHDLPFLNQIIRRAEAQGIDFQAHWLDRENGKPGHVTLNDVPATSKAYDTAEKARQWLAQAQKVSGTPRHAAICSGMGALRRTIEETVVKRLFKGIVPRWSDRVIVTKLRTIAWDNALADNFVGMYEELSAYIEGHSHTDEASGAPPEIRDLEQKIASVEALIKRARAERA